MEMFIWPKRGQPRMCEKPIIQVRARRRSHTKHKTQKSFDRLRLTALVVWVPRYTYHPHVSLSKACSWARSKQRGKKKSTKKSPLLWKSCRLHK